MSSDISILPTPLAGLKELVSCPRGDARGSLLRVFCTEALSDVVEDARVTQSNLTVTTHEGTVRGMHLQTEPHEEVKIVRCISGSVWDVAVDLRRHSPTFGQWHAVTLSPHQHNALLIPKGFAHGFQSLESKSTLLYFHSAAYQPEFESGIHCLDPDLAIAWPKSVERLSDRDQSLPSLRDWNEEINLS